MLRLTNDVLSSIPGYPPEPQILPEVLDWLDDLDQAWLSVLQAQVWDPAESAGVDLVIDADDALVGVKSSPLSQTERTRLRSLLIGGAATLEEWLSGLQEKEVDVESMMSRMGLQEAFDELFARTLDELGGLGGYVFEPITVDCGQ